MPAADRLIVALDLAEPAAALKVARRLRGVAPWIKIGSALFTRAGPAIVRRVRALGFQVMLDLKFFDIPSTVELSCRSATRHGIGLLTVHAGGGADMLRAAVLGVRAEAARVRLPRPKVLAVTVLTSVGGSAASARRRVLALAATAQAAGCDGVVASAQEARPIRTRFGPRLLIVCPGIRPAASGRHDQRRVCGPSEALARGADYLVIGRPITEAADPRRAVSEILRDMEGERVC